MELYYGYEKNKFRVCKFGYAGLRLCSVTSFGITCITPNRRYSGSSELPGKLKTIQFLVKYNDPLVFIKMRNILTI
jgi:hypothetical protein